MPVVADLAATAMLVVFAVALVAKSRSAMAFDDFAASLSQFGINSVRRQRLAAGGVLIVEATSCAGLLLLGHHPVVRFALPVLLLAFFALAIGLSAHRGQVTACHCFGTSATLPTRPHIVMNCGLALLGCLAMTSHPVDGSAGDAVLGIGLGLIVGILFASSADLYVALSTAPPAPVSRPRRES